MRLSTTLAPLLSILFVVALPAPENHFAPLAKRAISLGLFFPLPLPKIGRKLIGLMKRYTTLWSFTSNASTVLVYLLEYLPLSIDASSAYVNTCTKPNGNTFVSSVGSVFVKSKTFLL